MVSRTPARIASQRAIAVLLAVASARIAAAGTASPMPAPGPDLEACTDLLNDYLATVLAGATDEAARFWRREDVAAASRLGIRYAGVPLKVDGDSPLWLRVDAARAGTVVWRVVPPPDATAPAAADGAAVAIACGQGGEEAPFTYRFVREDGRWLLASPVRLACDDAPSYASRFIRLFDGRSRVTAPVPGRADDAGQLLAALDSCVSNMATVLELETGDLARLRAGKLDYLLTDPEEVARLAGAPTVGVANLQQDVVVTSHPCHAHELAHLVVNAWLRELPLFMLPVLQEGVAVHLGGRWGRDPRVLERVGRTALAEGWVNLDDLLTQGGFQGQPADLTYAPAGVFAGFLIQEFGAAGLRRACLAVAGDAPTVAAWDAAAVHERLARALATDWPTLERAFRRRFETPVGSGIRPGVAEPARGGGNRLAGRRLTVEVVAERDDDTVGVAVRGPGGAPEGAILFGGGDPDAAANELFSEHFPGRPYRGETHALVFTRDDVKLYDYRLRLLIALHAEGFWPSESYLADDGTGLRFSVDRALWPCGALTLVEERAD